MNKFCKRDRASDLSWQDIEGCDEVSVTLGNATFTIKVEDDALVVANLGSTGAGRIAIESRATNRIDIRAIQ